jgi:Glycosyl hydrolase family 26
LSLSVKKMLSAIAMPLAVAIILGGLLVATHHTTLPPMIHPSVPVSALTPAPSSSPGPPVTVADKACTGDIQHPFAGIAVKNNITGHVTSFERATGAHLKVIEYYNRFPGHFQLSAAMDAIDQGAVPMIQLNPRKVTMQQIVNGQFDSQIRSYADAVKTFGCRLILSFGHEMNGWWYSWGAPTTSPALYKLAWQHIYKIFAAEQVRNVIWSWDPTHQYMQYAAGKVASDASEWYPGDKYVNLIGIDGYLNPGQNFAEVFAHALADIRRVAHKPIFIAETGVAPNTNETEQIAELFAGLRAYKLDGLIWFEETAKQPWPLEGRPAADRAYHHEIAGFPK